MYFNDDSKIRVADILISEAITSYENWLKYFCLSYRLKNERLNLLKIDLVLPSFWEKPPEPGSPPEWLKEGYFYADLNRPIHPAAGETLRKIVSDRENDFEERLWKESVMTLYVLEGLRLHLVIAAAHSAHSKKSGYIMPEDINAAAAWKCWAWPWC